MLKRTFNCVLHLNLRNIFDLQGLFYLHAWAINCAIVGCKGEFRCTDGAWWNSDCSRNQRISCAKRSRTGFVQSGNKNVSCIFLKKRKRVCVFPMHTQIYENIKLSRDARSPNTFVVEVSTWVAQVMGYSSNTKGWPFPAGHSNERMSLIHRRVDSSWVYN